MESLLKTLWRRLRFYLIDWGLIARRGIFSIGGSDAVINDRPVTAYIMTQQPKLGAQLVHQPETYSADDFAFVFRKDQSALKDEVNAALAKLKSNGEYDKIYNKWFGKN